MPRQHGFTMIELVMVIVILGILAAVAMPRMVDLRDDAQSAVFDSVKASIATADAMNAATRAIPGTTKGLRTRGLTCAAAISALLQGGLPQGFTANTEPIDGTTGTQVGCEILNSYSDATTPITVTD